MNDPMTSSADLSVRHGNSQVHCLDMMEFNTECGPDVCAHRIEDRDAQQG